MTDQPLVCPSCGTGHARDERFCRECGVPLVHAEGVDDGGPEIGGELHERARKVRSEFRDGPLVRVAGARNQAEAEFIQGLLLEEGIPSLLRRTRGFDVPDFLAAGPRDVMVPQAGAQAATEVLRSADIVTGESSGAGPRPARLLAALLGGVALIAIIAWIGGELLS